MEPEIDLETQKTIEKSFQSVVDHFNPTSIKDEDREPFSFQGLINDLKDNEFTYEELRPPLNADTYCTGCQEYDTQDTNIWILLASIVGIIWGIGVGALFNDILGFIMVVGGIIGVFLQLRKGCVNCGSKEQFLYLHRHSNDLPKYRKIKIARLRKEREKEQARKAKREKLKQGKD